VTKGVLGAAPEGNCLTVNGNNLHEYIRPFNRKAAVIFASKFNFLSQKDAEEELMFNYRNEEGDGYGYDDDDNFVTFKKNASTTFRKSVFHVQRDQMKLHRSPSKPKSQSVKPFVLQMLPGPAYASTSELLPTYSDNNELPIIVEEPVSDSLSPQGIRLVFWLL
jgi:hypothetical protein